MASTAFWQALAPPSARGELGSRQQQRPHSPQASTLGGHSRQCGYSPTSTSLHAISWLESAACHALLHTARPLRAGRRPPYRGVRAREEVRTEQKVRIVLGPYKGGAISVTVSKPTVSAEEVDKALTAKAAKTSVLERVNFTGSGAKIGHTVRCSFEGKHADGPSRGQLIKGTKAANYELELKERDDEPWSSFVREITKAGMGQEESKSFDMTFPADYKAKALAGVRARFTVTIHEIGVKKQLDADGRPLEAQRAEVEAQLLAAAERASNDVADAQIRAALLESTEADVEKVAASVSWAKFGAKSLQDFKWNLILEEVARMEGVTFEQVPPLLRSFATVTYT